MKVLAIDDDLDDLEILCDCLAQIDSTITCHREKDGKDALNYLLHADQIPDIIFTDINMPVMNGKEFLEKLRLIPGLKNIKVVMLSTSIRQADIAFSKLHSAGYLTKPCGYEKFIIELTKILDP